MVSIEDEDLIRQDLWRTLLLMLGRLLHYQSVFLVNRLKNPKEVVPGELWIGLGLGIFPSRVAELIKALSGTDFPPFQDLLKVFCGGNLIQACSFCNINMTVAAEIG